MHMHTHKLTHVYLHMHMYIYLHLSQNKKKTQKNAAETSESHKNQWKTSKTNVDQTHTSKIFSLKKQPSCTSHFYHYQESAAEVSQEPLVYEASLSTSGVPGATTTTTTWSTWFTWDKKMGRALKQAERGYDVH